MKRKIEKMQKRDKSSDARFVENDFMKTIHEKATAQ